MNEIEKEFVPYQIALDMKSIGFDEPFSPFDTFYYRNGYLCEANKNAVKSFNSFNDEVILAPLYQQCWRWFRKKYGLEGVIQQSEDYIWYKWKISQYNEDGKKYVADWYEYETYEEAELECLKKLIKIVKEKL
jgi:hypothetical protein